MQRQQRLARLQRLTARSSLQRTQRRLASSQQQAVFSTRYSQRVQARSQRQQTRYVVTMRVALLTVQYSIHLISVMSQQTSDFSRLSLVGQRVFSSWQRVLSIVSTFLTCSHTARVAQVLSSHHSLLSSLT